ncbi:Hermansky-Pudlak syndrome 5 protein -like, partial [Asbolus verrucosus]
FTAFDVSFKYIIFGAKSGGIYIFSQESCQFLKLIPSAVRMDYFMKHGSVNLLLISDDESNLAIAVSTGLVVVLEDCFSTSVQQQVFSEHEGNTITAMKWNGNDLYCGDSTGRISVITLKSFLVQCHKIMTKAMFQTPVACLMHLDSQIVQLDTHSKFLLVSTLTRSLLCDTDTERYRQIGKKNRDGFFGACFFNVVNSVHEIGIMPHIRGTFQTVGDNEELSSSHIDDNVKIYCARPGARLWQADFQANVIYTHQFRASLNQKQTDIIYWDDSVEADLKISEFSDDVKLGPENFNFGKIFRFLDKFIVTFRDNGLYIFEPSSSTLLFWRHLSNVKDYTLCGQLCVNFFDEVQSLIGTSNKIHLISVLESKLDNCELSDKLSPIIQRLKDCSKTPSLEKLKNGIVNVTNYPNLPETVVNFRHEKNVKKDPHHIVLEQYRINKIHKNVETTDFKQLMESQNPRGIYDLITKLDIDSDFELWCKEMFLKYFKTPQDLDSQMLKYACEAYLLINNNKKLVCRCNFPLPTACKIVPKHYEIGCELMEKSDNYEIFLENVPYMHRHVLEKIDDLKEIQLKIPLIIQYSDPKIIKILSSKMPYDVWDDSLQLLVKLRSGSCLHCGGKIDSTGAFQWNDFGLLMVQSIKATNSIKLFKRYSHLLPRGELDEFFYQYCIFSTVSNLNSNIFNEIFHSESVKKQFQTSVGGYLSKKYLRGSDYDAPIANKSLESIPNCDHCQLPLKVPIIENTKKLNCGHCYHQKWLSYSDYSQELPNDHDHAKNIDTRTFTRPKKRFTRPSIEKYNEELYGNEWTDSGIQLNGCSQDDDTYTKPIHFDLTQPVSSSYCFDNVLANAVMADSFQNMSPPSLVNSMCSSTFANLMENSFIKNDPVLREIRDTDFTGLILQQESEPMFQSITESCSSLSSDVPENLLKKISFNEKNVSNSDAGDATVILNTTFAKELNSSKETITLDYYEDEDLQEAKAASCENLNSTFNKKLESTFKVPDVHNGTIKLNTTFQRRKSNRLNNEELQKQDLNSTITIEPKKINEERPVESIKRLLDRRPSPSLDLNRLSYQIDKNDQLNQTFTSEPVKRNSIESSDSTENLDYMSLSSGSSKSSSKILSMDGINTIVEMQERIVGLQVMSTPKPKNRTQILWHNNDISPISGRNSDPELSSSEKADIKPVIAQNTIKKQRSTGHINSKMPPPKSVNTVSQLAAVRNHIRSSQPNLKIAETKTYALHRPTNLNSMGHTLKGSYTSLKPMNPNLPVAPPPLDSTVTRNPTVAQVSPTPRENAPKHENAQFVKPQLPRSSGLPRPVTGIPRPVSRIPGPKGVR